MPKSNLAGLAMLVWADIAPEFEAGFNEWYNREHVPDRVLRVPGFVQGRRLVALSGGPRYVMFYDIAGPEVLASEVYIRARRNSDENSRRFQPHIGNVLRLLGDTIADAGQGEGGVAAMVAVEPADDPERFEIWARSALAPVVEQPGIMRARLFRANRGYMADVEQRSAGSVRAGLRPPDRIVKWMLVVEGTLPAHVAAIRDELTPGIRCNGGDVIASAVVQQMMRLAS